MSAARGGRHLSPGQRREVEAIIAGVRREEAMLLGGLDAARTEAARMFDVARRLSEDPEKAHAEMGDEEFYLWARKLAGTVALFGLAQLLQARRDACEAFLEGCHIDAL
jgi:hypothetical protein